jgi:hypothetical protein
VLLAYIPAIAFWGLDGYFLSLERGYRDLYDKVRDTDPDEIDFDMSLPAQSLGWTGWASAFLSKTLIIFHGSLIAAILVVMLIQL